ncbi:hypothetical protein [Pseudomonas sp. YL-218 TE3947]|uniref:hypothetical protein n=1 Tax=Pseudomonas TaxID=286 RepID=UPI003D21349C
MAIVAIVGFGFAIYQTYFYERRGEITVTLTPPTRLLDIRKAVGGLDVSYAGENLRDGKKTLWVVSATIRNDGNAEIRKGDFDDNDLVGFRVEKGKVVDTPSLRTSVDYLQRNLSLIQHENQITMTSAIIEPGDTIFISFLVLGDESSGPAISPLGKVAGSPSIQFRSAEDTQHSTLLDSVIGSDKWWVQPLRMLFYFAAFVAAAAIVGSLVGACVVLIDKVKEAKKRDARRSRVDKYKHEETVTKEARALGFIYVSKGEKAIHRLYRLLQFLEVRAILRERLDKVYSGEELEWIASKCFRIPSYQRGFMKDLKSFGFSISDSSSSDEVKSWVFELEEIARYLVINLDSEFPSDMLHFESGFDVEAHLIEMEDDYAIVTSTKVKR